MEMRLRIPVISNPPSARSTAVKASLAMSHGYYRDMPLARKRRDDLLLICFPINFLNYMLAAPPQVLHANHFLAEERIQV